MTRKLLPALYIASALCALTLLIFFIYLAITGYISDSEIWAVTLAKNIREEWWHPWVFTRPIFYGVLSLAEAPFSSSIPIFMAAKTVGLLIGLLVLLLSFRLARTLAKSSGPVAPLIPILALLFLLANTGFINQGYRIRSDLLACALVLWALEKSLCHSGRLPLQALALWALPLAATPKAFMYIIPAFVFLNSRRAKEHAIFFLLFSFFSLTFLYPAGVSYFLNTMTTPELNAPFFSHERFVYLERILTNNTMLLLLFAGRVGTITIRLRRKMFESAESAQRQKNFLYFVAISLAILVASPDKVPFFLASFLPIISVFIALLIDDLWVICGAEIPPSRLGFYRNAMLGCFLFYCPALVAKSANDWSYFKENNNSEVQFRAIRQLEKYLHAYPAATYFDVVGLVPKRATLRLFAGPNERWNNQNTMRIIKQNPPDLIFYVRKSFYLEPELGALLNDQYFSIGNGIFARWKKLPAPLAITAANKTRILAAIEEMRTRAEATAGKKISILLRSPKSPLKRLVLNEEELFHSSVVGKRSEILALSPFLDLEPKLPFLHSIIRFDWEDGLTEDEGPGGLK